MADWVDLGGNVLEGFVTFEATVSFEYVDAKIDIQTGSVIDARNFVAYASSYGKIVASPLASIGGGFVVGVIVSHATVDVAGTITTTGDMTIKATTDHWLNVLNDNTAVKGMAMGFALGVLVSDTNAHVTDDAVLHVGGSLYVLAETIDRTRAMARSPAGKDGKVGIAAAISVEDGETNALLDGRVTVGGDVEVSATMVQEMVPIKKIFVIPAVSIGAIATAGVGSNSKGDILDDIKSMLTSIGSNFVRQFVLPKLATVATKLFAAIKAKFGGSDSEKPSSEAPSQDSSAFQFAGGIAVVVDSNRTTARIGDGNTDNDGKNGEVDAGGYVSVFSSITSSPWISASTSTSANPDAKPQPGGDEFSVSGSLALSVGIYTNNAKAYIGSGAKVDAAGAISVNGETYNNFIFSWFKNLWDVLHETATFTTEDDVQNVKVHTGDTVEVRDNHTGGGDVGTWYEYLGITPKDITLATEDFTDENLWLATDPVARKRDAFLALLPTYLSGDFGFSNWIANSMSVATADGADLSIAGAITFLNLRQNAEAVIHSGALVNQETHTGTGQAVTVTAINHNETVNLGGNIALPAFQVSADRPWKTKKGYNVINTLGSPIYPKNWQKTKEWWKDFLPKTGPGAKANQGAVGITLMGFNFDDTTTAKIADGVRLHADSLYVDAETHVLSVDIGASGGKSGNVGFNGAVVTNVVNNETHAQIASGAIIDVGSGLVFDPTENPPENGSIIVHAGDNSLVIGLVGGVAVSDHIGIGASVGVNVVLRDTQAVIGDLKDDPLICGGDRESHLGRGCPGPC